MPIHNMQDVIINATLYTLMGFAAITWTLIAYKSWQLTKTGFNNKKFIASFWDAADLRSAAQLPPEIAKGSKARVAASGFNWITETNTPSALTSLKFRGARKELLEQTLRQQTQVEQRRMESGLTLLASIGSTAPFVGLFGTVVGIMHAMQQISQNGSASLDVVAGPIGDALIATAFGIAVAVPAVLAYNFFLRRAKHHRASLEHFVDGFLHIAFADNTGN